MNIMAGDTTNEPAKPLDHASDLLNAGTLLYRASKLVEQAASLLNTKSKQCEGCGTAHYDSFEEFTQGRDLRAASAKLKQRARRLESMGRQATPGRVQ